jgi:hypothetical protein
MGSDVPPTKVSWAPLRIALGSKFDMAGRYRCSLKPGRYDYSVLRDSKERDVVNCLTQLTSSFYTPNAKMSKNCSELTPLWDEGDAALCSPPARASRVRDHL